MWIAAQTYTLEKLPWALEQKAAHFIVVRTQVANRGSYRTPKQRLLLMYNPFGPWNAWFALSSQAARVCWATQAGMLRGVAQAGVKAETETDRMVIENVAAEAQIPTAARKSNKKRRVANKALSVAAKRDRRNRQRVRSDRVRSGRVDHRIEKIQKRRRQS
jgi:hypothetical protein